MVATLETQPSIFLADESRVVCRLMAQWFVAAGFRIAGMAHDGPAAVASIQQLRPDVATVALKLPQQDGLRVIAQVMAHAPTPIVVVSGVTREAAALTMQALELGAIDFAAKFTHDHREHSALQAEIVSKVRVAAKIKAIRRLEPTSRHSTTPRAAKIELPTPGIRMLNVVVIGASTGGPIAVRELLGALPANFPAAVIVVQHMPEMFTNIFASQINQQIPLHVKEAATGDTLQPGRVLIAPGDWHLLLEGKTVRLVQGPKIRGFRPSVDVTMQSVAQQIGLNLAGVILTGMGSDGSIGLASIRARGGRTFAQDALSSVVNGMPQAAIDRGVVEVVDTPQGLARRLCSVFASHAL